MNEFDRLLETLQGMDIDRNNLNEIYKKIKRIYIEIFKHHLGEILQIELKQGQQLFRVRKNIHDLNFRALSELYSPPDHLTYFGRVNLKRRPIYYCSDNSNTAILESKPKKGEYLTEVKSIYISTGKLQVFGNCNRYKTEHIVSENLKKFYDLATELINRDVSHPDEYLFTASLSEVLLTDKSFDGIMYPSKYSKQRGDNLALRVENLKNKLLFNSARIYRVEEVISQNNVMIKCIGECSHLNAEGEFLWSQVSNCKTHEINFENTTPAMES